MTISTVIANIMVWSTLGWLLFGPMGTVAGPICTLVSYLLHKKAMSDLDNPNKLYPPFDD